MNHVKNRPKNHVLTPFSHCNIPTKYRVIFNRLVVLVFHLAFKQAELTEKKSYSVTKTLGVCAINLKSSKKAG